MGTNSLSDLDLQRQEPVRASTTSATAKPHQSFAMGVHETCRVYLVFLVRCSPERPTRTRNYVIFTCLMLISNIFECYHGIL